jgi:hypothetical protein
MGPYPSDVNDTVPDIEHTLLWNFSLESVFKGTDHTFTHGKATTTTTTGRRQGEEDVKVQLSLYYLIFSEGWYHTNSVPYVFTAHEEEAPQLPTQTPRILSVSPPLLRLPRRRRADAPALALFEVVLGPPESREFGNWLDPFKDSGVFGAPGLWRCRLKTAGDQPFTTINIPMDAIPLRAPLRPSNDEKTVSGEETPRVLCVLRAGTSLGGAGQEKLFAQTQLQISIDNGITWSGHSDQALVQVIGPDVLDIHKVVPNVRLLESPPANVTLLGNGFSMLRAVLSSAGGAAPLECIWAPQSIRSRVAGKCRSKAYLTNDTAILSRSRR